MKRFIIPLLVCMLIALPVIPPTVAHAQENPAAVRHFDYAWCTTSLDVYIDAVDFGYLGQVVETIPSNFHYVSATPISGLDGLGVTSEGQDIIFSLSCEPGATLVKFSYTLETLPTCEGFKFDGVLIDEFGRQYPVGGDRVTFGRPWTYDTNWDCIMSKSEALVAIADYFAGYITKAQALEVIAIYFEGWDGG